MKGISTSKELHKMRYPPFTHVPHPALAALPDPTPEVRHA